MSRVELIVGQDRRRAWDDDQKRRIVEEAFGPDGGVSDTARRHDIRPGQIYRWRQELQTATDGFAQVIVAVPPGGVELPPRPAIEIDVGDMRVRIAGTAPRDLAMCVVKALGQR